ncbi:MAG: hypothetical protein KGI09_05595 [Thaumarchaeota archaeon]|nr:hypothetical protein [Nitrososphaerota archaeon]
MTDSWSFILVSIPVMLVFGMRHALDVDHITVIDNLVRLHHTTKKSRMVGAGFSSGHMISVLAEMIFIIYIVGSLTTTGNLQFWGGIAGAIALAVIGGINIYAIKKWEKSGAAILASKVLNRVGILGPVGSSFVTGLVFGLGFDTATQISAITISAVASATAGIQTALILSGFFALGMIPIDTLDSVVLRSAFSRIFDTKDFRYMAYALSGLAIMVASFESYSTLASTSVLPEWIGPVLAVSIISISFGYIFATKKRQRLHSDTRTNSKENKL